MITNMHIKYPTFIGFINNSINSSTVKSLLLLGPFEIDKKVPKAIKAMPIAPFDVTFSEKINWPKIALAIVLIEPNGAIVDTGEKESAIKLEISVNPRHTNPNKNGHRRIKGLLMRRV